MRLGMIIFKAINRFYIKDTSVQSLFNVFIFARESEFHTVCRQNSQMRLKKLLENGYTSVKTFGYRSAN